MASEDDLTDSDLSLSDDLPTLPETAIMVSSELDKRGASLDQLTDTIKADVVLTARLLKLANPEGEKSTGGISTVERALSKVGYNALFKMLVGVKVVRFDRIAGDSGLGARDLWGHALGVALASELIGERVGIEDPAEAFSAGLLHDIGKIVMAVTGFERFEAAVSLAMKNHISFAQAEKSLGLPSHDDVGYMLAEKWRFPPCLRTVIRAHHLEVRLFPKCVPDEHGTLLDIVACADVLCRRYQVGNPGDPIAPKLDEASASRLSLDDAALDEVKKKLTARIAKSPAFSALLSTTD